MLMQILVFKGNKGKAYEWKYIVTWMPVFVAFHISGSNHWENLWAVELTKFPIFANKSIHFM